MSSLSASTTIPANLAANYRNSGDTNMETLQVQKNQPLGEGVGFQANFSLFQGRLSNFKPDLISP